MGEFTLFNDKRRAKECALELALFYPKIEDSTAVARDELECAVDSEANIGRITNRLPVLRQNGINSLNAVFAIGFIFILLFSMLALLNVRIFRGVIASDDVSREAIIGAIFLIFTLYIAAGMLARFLSFKTCRRLNLRFKNLVAPNSKKKAGFIKGIIITLKSPIYWIVWPIGSIIICKMFPLLPDPHSLGLSDSLVWGVSSALTAGGLFWGIRLLVIKKFSNSRFEKVLSKGMFWDAWWLQYIATILWLGGVFHRVKPENVSSGSIMAAVVFVSLVVLQTCVFTNEYKYLLFKHDGTKYELSKMYNKQWGGYGRFDPDIHVRPYHLNTLHKLIGFRPFKLGMVWWWILIIGCVLAFTDAAIYIDNIDKECLENCEDVKNTYIMNTLLLKKVIPVLSFAVFAYIAENLIGELLSTKDFISTSSRDIQSVTDRFQSTKMALSKTTEKANQTVTSLGTLTQNMDIHQSATKIVEFAKKVGEIGNSEGDFADRYAEESSSVFLEKFLGSTEGLLDSFNHLTNEPGRSQNSPAEHDSNAINSTESEKSAPFLLHAFAEAVSQSTRVFSASVNDSLTKPGAFYGDWGSISNIASSIIGAANEVGGDDGAIGAPSIEFYTVLAMLPSTFIGLAAKNKMIWPVAADDSGTSGTSRKYQAWERDIINPDPESETDKGDTTTPWLDFLNAIHKSGQNNNIRIVRQFLSRTHEVVESEDPYDEKAIFEVNILKENLRNVKVKTPENFDSGVEFFKKEKSNSPTVKERSILNVINKIHGGNSEARLVIIDSTDDLSLFLEKNTGQHVFEPESGTVEYGQKEANRLLDYFAVKHDGEWQMCVIGKIHQKSGVGEFHIYHQKVEGFDRIKEKLNIIFPETIDDGEKKFGHLKFNTFERLLKNSDSADE